MDPLAFWKNNLIRFPISGSLVRHYLAIPATVGQQKLYLIPPTHLALIIMHSLQIHITLSIQL